MLRAACDSLSSDIVVCTYLMILVMSATATAPAAVVRFWAACVFFSVVLFAVQRAAQGYACVCVTKPVGGYHTDQCSILHV